STRKPDYKTGMLKQDNCDADLPVQQVKLPQKDNPCHTSDHLHLPHVNLLSISVGICTS
ncbi:hypothetical protein HN873_037532, partial [Arachis hypogaea]